jgi:hypothetical protein
MFGLMLSQKPSFFETAPFSHHITRSDCMAGCGAYGQIACALTRTRAHKSYPLPRVGRAANGGIGPAGCLSSVV